ncbi:MAG: zinc-dependent peptidase [Proteobacteria bacterium]|nr:zinc-dependent peptidase [Pseudomonadota bacterium]
MTAYQLGLLLAGLAALAVVASSIHSWRQHRTRLAFQQQPFPPAWRNTLLQSLPLYRLLPTELRARVERAALVFISRVDFVGCNGLAISDAMRAAVSIQAALLVINRSIDLYRPLRSVLIYPDAFVVPIEVQDDAGVVTQGEDLLSGQAIDTDVIVLAWPDVIGAAYGENLVLHECAHFLDHAAGGTLSSRPSHRVTASDWHDVLEAEYARLCRAVDAGARSLIDPYGSEDPSEFFAVATEAFFTRATDLARQNADLYALLRNFYGLDPADWGST